MIAAADMNYNPIIKLIHFNPTLTEKQVLISHSLKLSNVLSIISLGLYISIKEAPPACL